MDLGFFSQLTHEVQLGKNELLREGRKKQRVESELKQTKEALQLTQDELKATVASLEAEKVRLKILGVIGWRVRRITEGLSKLGRKLIIMSECFIHSRFLFL